MLARPLLLRPRSLRTLPHTFQHRNMTTSTIPTGFSVIEEGQAKIIYGTENQVFYNNVQVLNRDLSIAVIKHFSTERAKEHDRKEMKKMTCQKESSYEMQDFPGISVFEALSATGLRSIRYFKEIPHVTKILVNDIEPAAVEAIKRNIEFNCLDTTQLIPNEGDATMVMYQNRDPKNQFDVVDLDPYGSASPFLDGAVQSVSDGGLLCVTCTDGAVLSGNNPEMCFSRYGSMINRKPYLHEMGIRVLLSSIEASANRYARYIVPIISCSIDFYYRVFVRVYKSPAKVKDSPSKSALVFQCCNCESFHVHARARHNGKTHQINHAPKLGDKCDQCGGQFKIAGPMWSKPIHDMDAVKSIMETVEDQEYPPIPTKDRLHGLLTTVSEEVEDAPLFYTLPGICKILRCEGPPMNMLKGALMNAGYQVSQFHKCPEAVKTNAPHHVLWDIMRCWIKKHPLGKRRLTEDTPGNRILAQEPKLEANFTVPASLRYKTKALRFPPNPEANWGPKKRAVGNKRAAAGMENEDKNDEKKTKVEA